MFYCLAGPQSADLLAPVGNEAHDENRGDDREHEDADVVRLVDTRAALLSVRVLRLRGVGARGGKSKEEDDEGDDDHIEEPPGAQYCAGDVFSGLLYGAECVERSSFGHVAVLVSGHAAVLRGSPSKTSRPAVSSGNVAREYLRPSLCEAGGSRREV